MVARQWFPGEQVAGVINEQREQAGSRGLLPMPAHAYLVTRQGRFTVFAGDWIITSPDESQHLCCNRLFQRRHIATKDASHWLVRPQAHPIRVRP